MASQFCLYLGPHLHGNQLGGLENRLVGEHQAHVTVYADDALLHPVDVCLKLTGNQVDTLNQLTTDQRLGLVEVLCVVGHLHICRRVAHTDKLS